MQFFRIRNFEKFQHYRDRKPPWIKLYRDLWDDPRFFDLENSDRYLLIGLFVVASQHDNCIPLKQSWLKAQLLSTKAIPLQKFIDTEWIELVEQDASAALAADNTLASGLQGAIPRALAESREEKRRDRVETDRDAYGEFGHVWLSKAEHGKLLAKLNGSLSALIDRLDRWGEEEPGPFAKKKSHYATLLNWFDRDLKQGILPHSRKSGAVPPLAKPSMGAHFADDIWQPVTHIAACNHEYECTDRACMEPVTVGRYCPQCVTAYTLEVHQ